ncbi:ankyrin repeat-containing domain protein [Ilyonectria sp. MPI-CAGE-AT-0026]|nr:ankyrin repeat-containing domain protein [Ilyonectria sp. MPI-CAGE-AT-0026]
MTTPPNSTSIKRAWVESNCPSEAQCYYCAQPLSDQTRWELARTDKALCNNCLAPSFATLPAEIIRKITNYCSIEDRCVLVRICKRLYQLENERILKDDINSLEPKAVFSICSNYRNNRAALTAMKNAIAAGADLSKSQLRLSWIPLMQEFHIMRMLPIHIAAAYGQDLIIEELLAHGVSVNAHGVSVNTPSFSSFNITPLELAIRGHQLQTVQLLIELGASLEFGSGRTALHEAATAGSEKLVSLFLKKGLDIKAWDGSDPCPISYALLSPNDSWRTMIPYLLQHGAKICQRHISFAFINTSPEAATFLHQLRFERALPLSYSVPASQDIQMSSRVLATLSSHCTFGTVCKSLILQGKIELIPKHLFTRDIIPWGLLDRRVEEVTSGSIQSAFEDLPQILQLFEIARPLDEQWVSNYIPRSFTKLVDALSDGFTLDMFGVSQLLYKRPFEFENLREINLHN